LKRLVKEKKTLGENAPHSRKTCSRSVVGLRKTSRVHFEEEGNHEKETPETKKKNVYQSNYRWVSQRRPLKKREGEIRKQHKKNAKKLLAARGNKNRKIVQF